VLLTLHRSDLALYRGDLLLVAWTEHRFGPSPRHVDERPSGYTLLRSASVPVPVSVPIGSRLDGQPARLVTHFDACGLDAESVAHLARRRLRGFGPALAEASRPPGASVAEPSSPEPAPAPPVGLPTTTHSVSKWGIEFRSRNSGLRSFLAKGSFVAVRSTNALDEVARFSCRVIAESALQEFGLDPGRPVPIGVGFIFPGLAEVPSDPAELRGIEFELPRDATTTAPAVEREARTARASRQAAFAFGD
jgi:hypothetical protein